MQPYYFNCGQGDRMSSLVLANGPFLSVLLNTTNNQQLKLLQSLTPLQQKVLVEILSNINRLPHNSDDDLFLKQKRKFLQKLDEQKSLHKKYKLLRKYKIITQILNHFSGKILALL